MNREQLNLILAVLSFLSLALSVALMLKGNTASFYLRYISYLSWMILLVVMTVFLIVEIADPKEKAAR